jgi:hypothetical protein
MQQREPACVSHQQESSRCRCRAALRQCCHLPSGHGLQAESPQEHGSRRSRFNSVCHFRSPAPMLPGNQPELSRV